MKRVAVTGIGVISPLGNDLTAAFEAACQGRSGICTVETSFAQRLVAPIAATVKFDGAGHFDPLKLRMMDRVSQFAVVAANQAFEDADTQWTQVDRSRVGVFVGTGMGGTLSNDDGYKTLYGEGSDRIKPFSVLAGMPNAPAAWIGLEHSLTGPNLTYSTACCSSAVAIGEAWMRVASGVVDCAIAGGAEAPLSFGSMKAWEALHTVATVDTEAPATSCKPFSKNRTGMVLGEGAAMLVLENWDSAIARGAVIKGELMGYGLTTDASHITRPSVTGQAAAMSAALLSAGIETTDVDAINAHGTGTLANDATETAAIKLVFGAAAHRIPVSATKAMHGHLLGAAGALECALSLEAMQHQVLLPTLHLHLPDSECDLDYVPNDARRHVSTRVTLSNSFAFGGTNAVLVLGTAG